MNVPNLTIKEIDALLGVLRNALAGELDEDDEAQDRDLLEMAEMKLQDMKKAKAQRSITRRKAIGTGRGDNEFIYNCSECAEQLTIMAHTQHAAHLEARKWAWVYDNDSGKTLCPAHSGLKPQCTCAVRGGHHSETCALTMASK